MGAGSSLANERTPSLANAVTPFPVTHADVLKAAREIEVLSAGDGKPLNIVLLSSFTIDMLTPYVTVHLAVRGIRAATTVAPYGQVQQELLNKESATRTGDVQIIVVAVRIEDLVADLSAKLLDRAPDDLRVELLAAVDDLLGAVAAVAAGGKASVYVFNFCEPPQMAAGMAHVAEVYAEADMVFEANRRLGEFARRHASVHVIDYRGAAIGYGLQAWHDRKLWFWARCPLATGALPVLAAEIARRITAGLRPSCKCLVLDCDNTLWGGVVGEDGMDGIALGEYFPGNVYKDLHRYLKTLKARGILLAIASKNNREDALAVFTRHPDSLLKPDDFAAMEIHWNDKAASVRAIATQLNIGLDAIAFFDDSPVERQWMLEALPMVHTIAVPEQPLEYVETIAGSGLFDQLSISSEDRQRHALYQAEKGRRQLQDTEVSIEGFLRRLEMKAVIGRIDEATLQRAGQLLLKTNQFNLTLRRHSPPELQSMLREGGIGLWMRLVDRFGDNGLIALALAKPDGEVWEVDTFLMSCRVLGRQAESLLLGHLMHLCRAAGGRQMRGIYVAGPKNQMVGDFYEQHQFRPSRVAGEWTFDLGRDPLPTADFIDVDFSGMT